MPHKDPLDYKEYHRKYREKNREKCREKVRKWQKEHGAQYTREWRKRNPEKMKIYEKRRSNESRRRSYINCKNKLRSIIFEHYGKVCACCGESNMGFLSIDHINGGGNKHRRDNNIKSSMSTYRWLRDNNYPEGFQTLCYNCNLGRAFNSEAKGVCPHKMGVE